MKYWKEKYSAGGVCDFRQNYDFYFKWLLNKVCSCFVVSGLPDTINQTYLKNELILSGCCCITDFGGKLYACAGNLGGNPDEYYIPTIFTIANPVLGSKQVRRGKNGVVIFNTDIDELYTDCFSAGLYQYINQTATLLADNIVSINVNQINSRVCTFFTADSDAKALAGETVLKKMYSGQPFQIIRQDIIEKININPISTEATSSNITELVELNNYIISNFMQSIGIKANNVRKRERLITDEIESQKEYIGFSVMEALQSWQKGFDETSKLYKDILEGERISVSLNPAIIDSIISAIVPHGTSEKKPAADADSIEPEKTETGADSAKAVPETKTAEDADSIEPEQVEEHIENQAEIIGIIAEAAEGVKADELRTEIEEDKNGEDVERNPDGD